MKLIIFVGGFIIGFVTGAYGYKKYVEGQEDTIYDFDDSEDDTKVEKKIVRIRKEETEHPQDSDEDEVEVEFDQNGYQMTEEYEINKDLPPTMLSPLEAYCLPSSVQNGILWYYEDDMVLIDDEDKSVIENPEYFLGNCLEAFDDKNINTIFVLNHSLNTLYEVGRKHGDYDGYL